MCLHISLKLRNTFFFSRKMSTTLSASEHARITARVQEMRVQEANEMMIRDPLSHVLTIRRSMFYKRRVERFHSPETSPSAFSADLSALCDAANDESFASRIAWKAMEMFLAPTVREEKKILDDLTMPAVIKALEIIGRKKRHTAEELWRLVDGNTEEVLMLNDGEIVDVLCQQVREVDAKKRAGSLFSTRVIYRNPTTGEVEITN